MIGEYVAPSLLPVLNTHPEGEMTTLHYLNDRGEPQTIEARAFVLNGKTILAVGEDGAKRSVAVCAGGSWRSSSGRLRHLRFAADILTVRHDDHELHRGNTLRLTGSRGRLPRLGTLAALDHGLWRLATVVEPAIGRLVVTRPGHLPAQVRAALAA